LSETGHGVPGIVSEGYNLVGNGTGCPTGGTDQTVAPGSVFTTVLGPLQDNGGPTFTHALLSGSPAINAGNPDTPGSGGNSCTARDQRGYSRNGRCDVGAFEFGGSPNQPPDTTITSTPANPSNSSSASFEFTGSDDVTPLRT
jgi:hypothetical protein